MFQGNGHVYSLASKTPWDITSDLEVLRNMG